MKFLSLLIAVLIVGISPHAALSQCCCSKAEFTITDDGGQPLKISDVKISVASDQSRGGASFVENDIDEARVQFRIGCGSGKESLLLEYLGGEMRIRFKLYGEFGRPKGEVAFSRGDYVAELEKERDDEGARKLVFRKATEKEMKEIEPPAVTDEPPDQTTSPL
jgi:hypothetical protein